ncbi:transcriptional repressor [bacterium]|nr:transcriptional repressor [bacterium]
MARELLQALDQAGVRLTGPRRELAALIARRQGHFTAADLLTDAEQHSLRIGRATVFRLLEILADQNLVERVDLPDGRHAYVPCEPSHHHHLVCVSCGAISEVDDCGIDAVTDEAARRSGFEIQSHRLELFGRCPRCRSVEPRQ